MKTLRTSSKARFLSVCLWLSVISGTSVVTFCAVTALPILLTSCGTTEVAKGQQAIHVSAISFDKFVNFEKANRAQLWKINPDIKHAADKLRHRECATCDPNGIRWLESAWRTVEAYRTNRTSENKFSMDTAIAVIQRLVTELGDYFLDPQVAMLDQSTAATYRNAKVIP